MYGRKHCYRLYTRHFNEAVHWACAVQKVIDTKAPVETPTQLLLRDIEVRACVRVCVCVCVCVSSACRCIQTVKHTLAHRQTHVHTDRHTCTLQHTNERLHSCC